VYSSPNIGVTKLRRMKWVEHVTHMGETGNAYNILIRKTEGKGHLEDLGVNGRITLEYILEK
jgi:hypothetical protein